MCESQGSGYRAALLLKGLLNPLHAHYGCCAVCYNKQQEQRIVKLVCVVCLKPELMQDHEA